MLGAVQKLRLRVVTCHIGKPMQHPRPLGLHDVPDREKLVSWPVFGIRCPSLDKSGWPLSRRFQAMGQGRDLNSTYMKASTRMVVYTSS